MARYRIMARERHIRAVLVRLRLHGHLHPLMEAAREEGFREIYRDAVCVGKVIADLEAEAR